MLKSQMSEPTVVVVEDDPDLLTMFKSMVEEMGLRVVGAVGRGDEAIDRIHELVPDLVLVDLGLPGVSGVEVIAATHRRNPGIKFIAITAHSSGPLFDGALAEGASYLEKPCTPSELRRAIDFALDGGRYLTPQVTETVVEGYLKGIPRDSGGLTARQNEVADLIEEGLANKEIAVRLDVAVRTVEVHRALLMKRLGVRNAAELVAQRLKHRLSAVGRAANGRTT